MNRTITTAAELDALPAWAAVEDVLGIAWVKHPAMPGRADVWVSYYGEHVALEAPLTVLHDPSVPAPSTTREDVGEALHPGLFSLSDYEYARRFDNHGAEARARHQEAVLADEVDPLLARFTITQKEATR